MAGFLSILLDVFRVSGNDHIYGWGGLLLVVLLIVALFGGFPQIPRWGVLQPENRWGVDSVIYVLLIVVVVIVALRFLRILI